MTNLLRLAGLSDAEVRAEDKAARAALAQVDTRATEERATIAQAALEYADAMGTPAGKAFQFQGYRTEQTVFIHRKQRKLIFYGETGTPTAQQYTLLEDHLIAAAREYRYRIFARKTGRFITKLLSGLPEHLSQEEVDQIATETRANYDLDRRVRNQDFWRLILHLRGQQTPTDAAVAFAAIPIPVDFAALEEMDFDTLIAEEKRAKSVAEKLRRRLSREHDKFHEDALTYANALGIKTHQAFRYHGHERPQKVYGKANNRALYFEGPTNTPLEQQTLLAEEYFEAVKHERRFRRLEKDATRAISYRIGRWPAPVIQGIDICREIEDIFGYESIDSRSFWRIVDKIRAAQKAAAELNDEHQTPA